MPTTALLATASIEEYESRYHLPYLITALFLFYTAVTGNFIDQLVGTGMRQLLEHRWMQHLVGYLLLLFTISLVSGRNAWETLWLSAVLYLWFLLTTKTDKWLNLAVLLLLAVGFFLHQLLITQYTTAWAGEDPHRQSIICTLHATVVAIFATLVGMTIIGNGIYMRKQMREHTDFRLMTYIFGGKGTKGE